MKHTTHTSCQVEIPPKVLFQPTRPSIVKERESGIDKYLKALCKETTLVRSATFQIFFGTFAHGVGAVRATNGSAERGWYPCLFSLLTSSTRAGDTKRKGRALRLDVEARRSQSDTKAAFFHPPFARAPVLFRRPDFVHFDPGHVFTKARAQARRRVWREEQRCHFWWLHRWEYLYRWR